METDSVEGQRLRPSGPKRFDLLKDVGSRPARFANAEGVSSWRLASVSMALQIVSCDSMIESPQVEQVAEKLLSFTSEI
ncbi:hypothetical protein AGR13a_Cc30121 [Agrobacterium genomosp. 13 str. CFBP 6927]|uniref:Uncharacterized protein n=1 Tax=Agrobacterium genomosp. 13 str. CFBP 6927 TaxID=1183428 RepID=A0ABP2BGQ2_9HYPH|nr:hypothetical protein AGR13a_Cc30121 [Agrobacterium genomosp. 13 str. CFBP 6927]